VDISATHEIYLEGASFFLLSVVNQAVYLLSIQRSPGKRPDSKSDIAIGLVTRGLSRTN
jgi:hypothetical protein